MLEWAFWHSYTSDTRGRCTTVEALESLPKGKGRLPKPQRRRKGSLGSWSAPHSLSARGMASQPRRGSTMYGRRGSVNINAIDMTEDMPTGGKPDKKPGGNSDKKSGCAALRDGCSLHSAPCPQGGRPIPTSPLPCGTTCQVMWTWTFQHCAPPLLGRAALSACSSLLAMRSGVSAHMLCDTCARLGEISMLGPHLTALCPGAGINGRT